MFYGSTIELAEPPNTKQPCIFYVFEDGIVAIRPPAGTYTISSNEANHIRAMTMVYLYGLELIKGVPDITATAFASTMSTVPDQAGKYVQTEAILALDITKAELAKKGLLGAVVTIQIKGKELVLVGGKKTAKEFGGFLAKLLGDRFITSLK